jgi:hypothetical protein
VDNDRPDENDQKGDLVQEQAPGHIISIEFVKEDAALFGNPAGNGHKGESSEKLFGLGLVYNAK